MEYILVGILVFFNLVFIVWKFDHARYADAFLDTFLLILVAAFFSGSYGALVVGTIASALVSIYLFFSPPKFRFINSIKESLSF